jgi:mRNA-degrading endonuclease RelE of RelBE toxin-antitoxin system
MDKIKKFLRKLNKKQRKVALVTLYKIRDGDLEGIDVKKLVGRHKVYRVRVGSMRIFFIEEKDNYKVVSFEWRSDNTYS